MKPLFLGLAILASTVRAIPVNMPNARAFEETGTASATLSKRQDDWDVWRNELTNVAGVGCKPITVIFARGTIELGNVGDLVGPPFFDDLDDLIGADNIAVQGVDYPATIGGYLIGGDLGGAQTTADLLNQAANNCPDTKIVLSGYSVRIFGAHVSPFEPKHEPRDMSRKFLLSEHAFRFHTPPWIGNADRETIIQQGAMEVHLGEAMVSAEVAAQIAAVVSRTLAMYVGPILICRNRWYLGIHSKDVPSPTWIPAKS